MTDLPPVPARDRRIANFRDGTYLPVLTEDGRPDGEALQVNGGRPGQGFHVYRMAPGQHTVPHEHLGDEEFLLLEGDLRDHDGTVYRPGDLVWLRDGTRHSSYSQGGCLLAVYLRDTRSL